MANKKRKVGRPKLPANQLRAVVAIRLSHEEKQQFENAAKARGLPLGSWIRETLTHALKN